MKIGFIQSAYTVNEGKGALIVGVEVTEGSLEIPINLLLSIEGQSAEGK